MTDPRSGGPDTRRWNWCVRSLLSAPPRRSSHSETGSGVTVSGGTEAERLGQRLKAIRLLLGESTLETLSGGARKRVLDPDEWEGIYEDLHEIERELAGRLAPAEPPPQVWPSEWSAKLLDLVAQYGKAQFAEGNGWSDDPEANEAPNTRSAVVWKAIFGMVRSSDAAPPREPSPELRAARMLYALVNELYEKAMQSPTHTVSVVAQLLGAVLLNATKVLGGVSAPPPSPLWEALKTYGQHRIGCPHPSCSRCGTHTMAASKTPGYSYCTRCGLGSQPTTNEACDCGFEAALAAFASGPPSGTAPE